MLLACDCVCVFVCMVISISLYALELRPESAGIYAIVYNTSLFYGIILHSIVVFHLCISGSYTSPGELGSFSCAQIAVSARQHVCVIINAKKCARRVPLYALRRLVALCNPKPKAVGFVRCLKLHSEKECNWLLRTNWKHFSSTHQQLGPTSDTERLLLNFTIMLCSWLRKLSVKCDRKTVFKPHRYAQISCDSWARKKATTYSRHDIYTKQEQQYRQGHNVFGGYMVM